MKDVIIYLFSSYQGALQVTAGHVASSQAGWVLALPLFAMGLSLDPSTVQQGHSKQSSMSTGTAPMEVDRPHQPANCKFPKH